MAIEEKTQSVHSSHFITVGLTGGMSFGGGLWSGGGGAVGVLWQMGGVNCPISDPFCFNLERQYPITLTSQ